MRIKITELFISIIQGVAQGVFVTKDGLVTVQSFIAPMAVPFVPAIFSGSKSFELLVTDVPYGIAIAGAIISAIGIESVGSISSYVTIKKWKQRDWVGMLIALFFVCVYIGALAYLAYFFEAPILLIFAILSPGAFFVSGMLVDDSKREVREEKEADRELEILKVKKNLINAETRKIRAGEAEGLDMSVLQHKSGPVQMFIEQSEQGEQPKTVEITPLGQKIIDMFNVNPRASLRDIAGELGCSPTTVKNWKKVWVQNK